MTLNGSLAGLVAITAGCDTVTPVGAALMGVIAGFAVVFGIEFVDQKLEGRRSGRGRWRTWSLWSVFERLLDRVVLPYYDFGNGEKLGVFYGGGIHFFGLQILGVVVVTAWVAVTMTIVFDVLKHTIGLRASAVEEIEGLDIRRARTRVGLCGLSAYLQHQQLQWKRNNCNSDRASEKSCSGG